MKKRTRWNTDEAATKARQFLSRHSFIDRHGKEFLGIKDWNVRRMEVYDRDRGVCTFCGEIVSVYVFEAHHHPVSRGKGGDDKIDNLKTICPPCHREQHPQTKFRKSLSTETDRQAEIPVEGV